MAAILLLLSAAAVNCGGGNSNTESAAGGDSVGGSGGAGAAAGGSVDAGGGGAAPCEPATTQACYTGAPNTQGVGACKAGIQVCNIEGTAWGACLNEILPVQETCATPVDDDCDGETNEEGENCACVPNAVEACYTGPDGTEGIGECAGGNRTCNALGSGHGQCVGETTPVADECNGLDDDCENGPDDAFACVANETVACTTACNTIGATTCSATCEAGPCVPPVETCNGQDEDCDGLSDNSIALFGTPHAPVATDSRRVAFAFSGTNFATAYLDLVGGANRKVMLQLYDLMGTPTGAPVEVTTTGGPLAIAWNGSVFGIYWTANFAGGGTFFRAYNATGTAQGPEVQVSSLNSQAEVAMIAKGTNFLVTIDNFTGAVTSPFQVTLLNSAGTALSGPHNITVGSGRVVSSAFADDGSGARLFWSDNRNGPYTIYSRPLDAVGLPTDTEAMLTSGIEPATIWSATKVPTGFVVAYQNSLETRLRSVDGAGAPNGQPATISSSPIDYPSVAWNGTGVSVLTSEEFQMRDTQLALVSSFPFAQPTPNSNRYATLLWSTAGYIGGYASSADSAVVRIFGQLGCDAP